MGKSTFKNFGSQTLANGEKRYTAERAMAALSDFNSRQNGGQGNALMSHDKERNKMALDTQNQLRGEGMFPELDENLLRAIRGFGSQY